MKKCKKGQGALEYLMTYGWALLIIVVVGAALYALGVLNPSTYTQSRCTGFQYFVWQDQKLNTSSYSVSVLNGNSDVTITALSINSQTVTMAGSQNASAGGKATLSGTVAVGKSAGEAFSYTVVITYDSIGGIQAKTDTATCTGKIQ